MDQGTITCSTCGARFRMKPELAGKTIKCKCGAHVKVPGGTYASVGAPAAATGMAPASAGMYGKRIKTGVATDEEKKSHLGLIIGALVVIAIVGVGFWFLNKSSTSKYPPAVAGDDKSILDTMEDHNAKEVRAWMKEDDQRMFSGMTRSQGNFYIDEMYNLGAKNIYAGGSRMAMQVFVELPLEPEKRAPFFNWYKTHGGALTKDVGQRYVIVGMWK